MKKTYKEKIQCDLCDGEGAINVINFNNINLKSRKLCDYNKIQKKTRCPICNGKGYLQIIRKK